MHPETIIVESGGIRPLVSLLSAPWEPAAELAAINLVRLTRTTKDAASHIADKGGITPLVQLLSDESPLYTPGAQQQAAAALAELALVPRNRDEIANAGGIKRLVELLCCPTYGTPETAARVLAHLALADDGPGAQTAGGPGGQVAADGADEKKALPKGGAAAREAEEGSEDLVHGSDERRAMVHQVGGVKRLISMLDVSNLTGKQTIMVKGIGLPIENINVGMQEQGAATLADVAFENADMQDAVIELGGIPSLLVFMRTGAPTYYTHIPAPAHARRARTRPSRRAPVHAPIHMRAQTARSRARARTASHAVQARSLGKSMQLAS